MGCMGLRRIWDLGIILYRLWTDSMEVYGIDILKNYEDHDDKNLIEMYQNLLKRYWRVHVSWISREDNQIADYFSKYALSCMCGVQVFPRDVAFLMLADNGIR